MSLNELLENQVKPWLNIRVENLVVDGYAISVSSVFGLTGGSNPVNSQGGHQYELSGFTGGATLTLGSVVPDGQVLTFVVDAVMVGACTISAGSGIISGNFVGSTGSGVNKNYSSASNLVVGTTASVGDFFQLRSANGLWLVYGVVKLCSAYT
jgi:hypothetical protein